MKVNSITAHSDIGDNIKNKFIFTGSLMADLAEFFKEKNYGVGVQNILYRNFCLKDGYNDKLLYYGPKRKIIDCAIVFDFDSVLQISNEEFRDKLAQLYLERSRQFADLKPKNFKADEFVSDLESFFSKTG